MKTAEDAKDAEESMVAFSIYCASLRFWSGPERVLRKTESTMAFQIFPSKPPRPLRPLRFQNKSRGESRGLMNQSN